MAAEGGAAARGAAEEQRHRREGGARGGGALRLLRCACCASQLHHRREPLAWIASVDGSIFMCQLNLQPQSWECAGLWLAVRACMSAVSRETHACAGDLSQAQEVAQQAIGFQQTVEKVPPLGLVASRIA